ncbi:MAG: recombinase family protein [Bacillota bacterium]
MARKSRKNKLDNIVENVIVEPRFRTAIYARLSVEKNDRDTIDNQIAYCKDFIDNHLELSLTDVYADHGVTGTTFNRAEMNRLLADIKNQRINCLVVKDLSRFGRDYIETGIYLERIFPNLNIRFIAINENFDNYSENTSNEALMIPLQNMINALYAKDISRKICSTLQTNMRTGTFKPSSLPYGYQLNESRAMIIDEAVAPFIRLMFAWKLNGISSTAIVHRLNAMHIPTPMGQKTGNSSAWARGSLEKIFVNPCYVGDTILGKHRTAFYRGEARHKIENKDEWFVFPDTHEPIISRENFTKVQELLQHSTAEWNEKKAKTESIRGTFVDLFHDKIFCGDCQQKLYFTKKKMDYKGYETEKNLWYAHYICSAYAKSRENCHAHYIRQDVLNEHVLEIIQLQVKIGVDYEKLILKLKDTKEERSIKEKQNSNIQGLRLKASGVQGRIRRLYDDLTVGILTKEEYLFAKQSLYDELDGLNGALAEAVMRKKDFDSALSAENQWIHLMKSVSGAKDLTQELVNSVIEKVLVYDSSRIEIVMRYDDIYRLTKDIVDGLEKEKEKEKY